MGCSSSEDGALISMTEDDVKSSYAEISSSIILGGNTSSMGTSLPRTFRTRSIFARRSAVGLGMVNSGSKRESQSESRVGASERRSLGGRGRGFDERSIDDSDLCLGDMSADIERECDRRGSREARW